MGDADDLLATGFYATLTIPTIVGLISFGPVDLSRATYNRIIGDHMTLKQRLGEYNICQDEIKNNTTRRESISQLARELNLQVEEGTINFRDASTSDLFEAAERRSDFYDDYVWTRLDQYTIGNCDRRVYPAKYQSVEDCVQNDPNCPIAIR